MPDFDVDPLLEAMLDAAPTVSDLNLSVGRPPQVEVDGQLRGVAYASIERLMPYHTELIALRLMRGKKDLADRTGTDRLGRPLLLFANANSVSGQHLFPAGELLHRVAGYP